MISDNDYEVADISNLQEKLVSGFNIKTVNGDTVLGSGNMDVQEVLESGTNIKTVNNISLLGAGNMDVQEVLESGTNIKTINGETVLGSGNMEVQEVLVSGTNIKTFNGQSILDSGNVDIPYKYQRYWFVRKQDTFNYTIPSVPTDITSMIVGLPSLNTQNVPPFIFDTQNNLIKVDPSTTYPYGILLQFRMQLRVGGNGTRRVYIQLRRADGVGVVATQTFDFSSESGINQLRYMTSLVRTRVFGGSDSFQTDGFKVFIYTDTSGSIVFDPADVNNFQLNFESN